MKSFISLEEAIDILDANVKAIGTEEVELIKATGRIISEDIYSKIDNPPFNKSAMDGYAIIAEDSNGCNEIKVIDKVFAGEVSKAEVINKTAVRIMTGAPIPKGANAVIKQEDTIKGDNEFVTLKKVIKENENICFKGEDIKKGTLLVEKNKKLGVYVIDEENKMPKFVNIGEDYYKDAKYYYVDYNKNKESLNLYDRILLYPNFINKNIKVSR